MTVLTELRNRGVQETFIVCCDGLKVLPEPIRAPWPLADRQLCVVHLVRSPLRYTSKKHWGQVCREIREIYTAPTVDADAARFDEFAEQWRATYPAMIATWERAWAEFTPFLAFPVVLRTIVYTTHAIESLHARFRKAVRHRSHFPSEQAALKVLYLVANERRPGRSNPAGRVKDPAPHRLDAGVVGRRESGPAVRWAKAIEARLRSTVEVLATSAKSVKSRAQRAPVGPYCGVTLGRGTKRRPGRCIVYGERV